MLLQSSLTNGSKVTGQSIGLASREVTEKLVMIEQNGETRQTHEQDTTINNECHIKHFICRSVSAQLYVVKYLLTAFVQRHRSLIKVLCAHVLFSVYSALGLVDHQAK